MNKGHFYDDLLFMFNMQHTVIIIMNFFFQLNHNFSSFMAMAFACETELHSSLEGKSVCEGKYLYMYTD